MPSLVPAKPIGFNVPPPSTPQIRGYLCLYQKQAWIRKGVKMLILIAGGGIRAANLSVFVVLKVTVDSLQ
jgi:hypothetical protein